jgi:catechol 2,3-dioxygenase-like lactoylglutathione lyase family enzyme
MIFRLLLFSMSLALVFSPAVIAQDLPGLPSATLSQICINAENLDNLTDWYIKKLGFAIETQGKSPEIGGRRVVFLKLNEFIVQLVEADKDAVHDAEPKGVPAAFARPGLGHIYLRVGDADVAVQELKTRGVKIFSPAQVYTLEGTVYQRYSALVSDPEGNLIEIGEAPEVQETPTKRKKSQSQ